MKKILLALTLIPVVGMAAQSPDRFHGKDNTVLKSWVCQKYTDNEMDGKKGFLTDNPVIPMEFEIEQTKYDVVVKKNDLFKESLVMTIPEGGAMTGVSGNQHDMMFRSVDGNGKAYFIIYMTNPDPKSDGGINRGVVIADCDKQ